MAGKPARRAKALFYGVEAYIRSPPREHHREMIEDDLITGIMSVELTKRRGGIPGVLARTSKFIKSHNPTRIHGH